MSGCLAFPSLNRNFACRGRVVSLFAVVPGRSLFPLFLPGKGVIIFFPFVCFSLRSILSSGESDLNLFPGFPPPPRDAEDWCLCSFPFGFWRPAEESILSSIATFLPAGRWLQVYGGHIALSFSYSNFFRLLLVACRLPVSTSVFFVCLMVM